jgi:hypothetical protein
MGQERCRPIQRYVNVTAQGEDFMRDLRDHAARPDVHYQERYGKLYRNKEKELTGGLLEREPGQPQSPVKHSL